jgi:hypothetical protein
VADTPKCCTGIQVADNQVTNAHPAWLFVTTEECFPFEKLIPLACLNFTHEKRIYTSEVNAKR